MAGWAERCLAPGPQAWRLHREPPATERGEPRRERTCVCVWGGGKSHPSASAAPTKNQELDQLVDQR